MYSYNHNRNNDLLCQTLESQSEKIVNHKFIELLKFWGKYKLCDNVKNPNFLRDVFSTSMVSVDDVNRVMLRKYCLASYQENNTTSLINKYIAQGDYSEIDYLLLNDPNTRAVIFNIYLDNIHTNNGYLAIENGIVKRYDEVIKTLYEINTFYENKAYNNSRQKTYMKTARL